MSTPVTCKIKTLPEEHLIPAAKSAVEINPANAPVTHLLTLAAPDVVIPPLHLALLTAKRWSSDGVRLTVGFLDNPSAELKARILLHMNAWNTWANVEFVETNTDPQVRIDRAVDGYWSYVGTDITHRPADEATMNLEGFTMGTSEAKFHRLVRHETGHTLGFPHEHTRQAIVDRIDREKAIKLFMASQGWTKKQVIAQVLTPLENSALIATAEADINSIMCYWLPASIMKDGVEVAGGADVDFKDAQFAAMVYPKYGTIFQIATHWHSMPAGFTGAFDAALNGGGPFSGKCYFFKGDKYVRYDWITDHADSGYPQKISDKWHHLPSGFTSDFDCAINGAGIFAGKCYFFKGDKYVRYDWASDKADPDYPKKISDNWHKLPDGFKDNFDAMINGRGSFAGKLYMFKGDEYVRYDWQADRVDPGYPKKISDNWHRLPVGFTSSFNAALEGDIGFIGKGYFFKGDSYIRYDWAKDHADV